MGARASCCALAVHTVLPHVNPGGGAAPLSLFARLLVCVSLFAFAASCSFQTGVFSTALSSVRWWVYGWGSGYG